MTQAAPSTSAQWKLVPVEPTEAMIEAGEIGFSRYGGFPGAYRSMLASAPAPAPAPASGGVDVEALTYRVANAKLGEGDSVRCEGPTDFEKDQARAWVKRVLRAQASPSPAASPSGVRVRALEWSDAPFKYAPFDGPEVMLVIEGHGIGRRFATVVQCEDGKFSLFCDPTCERFDTIDEAKAAAQADYEARILSALASDATPAPTSGSEDGGELLCDDEGCPHHGTPHICVHSQETLSSSAGPAVEAEVIEFLRGKVDHAKATGAHRIDLSLYTRRVEAILAALYAHPAPATVEMRGVTTAMIDAAMVEMKNLHPPMRRSECERLLRAALAPATEGPK